VQEHHSRAQHAAAGDWGPKHVIDTTRMSADEAVRAVEARLREVEAAQPDAGPDTGSYLVRPPELEDAPALTAAWLDGGRYYAELDPEHFQVPEEDGLDGWTQRWICEDRDADSAILVAERNGAVVGYVHGSVTRPQPDAARQLMRELTEPVLHVDALMVRESYRRQGAGTALMLALERWAKGRGATRAFLSTFRHSPSSVPFYRDRMGYEDKSIGLWKTL
jgi:GNAT superfamily N-acetyltransferase